MLINLSNHPFEKWDEPHKQVAMADFGKVEDIPFPDVDPNADLDDVTQLAVDYLSVCLAKLKGSKDKTVAIHISGEPCFTFQFVTLAKAIILPCICSTTRRLVTNDENTKTSVFQFVKFRKY